MATAVATFNQLASSDLSSTSDTTVYTVPASTSAQINSVRLCNRGTATVYVRAWADKTGAGNTNTNLLVYDAPVPPGSWLELCDTKIIALPTGGKIWARCDTASKINVIISGMEITS